MTTKWYKYLPLAPAIVLGLVLGKALQSEFGYVGWIAAFVMAFAFEAVNLALAEHTAEHANYRRFKLVTTTITFQVVYIGIAFSAIALLGDGGPVKWFLALTPAVIGLALISGGLLQSVDAQKDRRRTEKIEDEDRAHRRKMEERAQANQHRQQLKAIGQKGVAQSQPATQDGATHPNKKAAKQAALADYEAGETNITALADKHGLHRVTLSRYINATANGNGVTK